MLFLENESEKTTRQEETVNSLSEANMITIHVWLGSFVETTVPVNETSDKVAERRER